MMTKLPENIRKYIENDGTSLLDGYLRFLKKEEMGSLYELLEKSPIWNAGIPFATTVFGDVLAWEDGYVMLYKMSEEDYTVMLSGATFFFENLKDPFYQADYFELNLYEQVQKKFGKIQSNECYVIEPIPALGGAREINYLSIGDMKTYLCLLI